MSDNEVPDFKTGMIANKMSDNEESDFEDFNFEEFDDEVQDFETSFEMNDGEMHDSETEYPDCDTVEVEITDDDFCEPKEDYKSVKAKVDFEILSAEEASAQMSNCISEFSNISQVSYFKVLYDKVMFLSSRQEITYFDIHISISSTYIELLCLTSKGVPYKSVHLPRLESVTVRPGRFIALNG